MVAVVWAENANPDPRLHNRLKDVGEKLDVPPLKEELRSLVDWVANYTLSARGMVLRMALRMGENLGPERMRLGVRLVGRAAAAHDAGAAAADRGAVGRPAARQIRSGARSRRQRRRDRRPGRRGHAGGRGDAAGAGAAGARSGFRAAGFLAAAAQPPWTRCARSPPTARFHVALLDGVTGSGKTEVYFEAIAEIIRRGEQALILMPEIALTGQFLDRFAQRFGVRPIEWHSELTPRTRARNWAAIAAGEAPVVVGARSALFLPYAESRPDHRR